MGILNGANASSMDERCTPYNPTETPVYRDARVFYSKAELEDQFTRLYESGHRLAERAYLDSTTGSFRLPYRDSSIEISDPFVQGLIKHIEVAQKNAYVDYVYYPDMGHGHLYLPTEEWQELKKIQNPTQRMEQVFRSKHLKALYHTMELLQVKEGDFASGRLPEDPWKLWRYFTRNLFADFTSNPKVDVVFAGSDKLYNTVRGVDGYTEINTFYISSSKAGCLPYKAAGKTYYFDLTFSGPPYAPVN